MKALLTLQDAGTGLEFKAGDHVSFKYKGRIVYTAIFRIKGKSIVCCNGPESVTVSTLFKKYKFKHIQELRLGRLF